MTTFLERSFVFILFNDDIQNGGFRIPYRIQNGGYLQAIEWVFESNRGTEGTHSNLLTCPTVISQIFALESRVWTTDGCMKPSAGECEWSRSACAGLNRPGGTCRLTHSNKKALSGLHVAVLMHYWALALNVRYVDLTLYKHLYTLHCVLFWCVNKVKIISKVSMNLFKYTFLLGFIICLGHEISCQQLFACEDIILTIFYTRNCYDKRLIVVTLAWIPGNLRSSYFLKRSIVDIDIGFKYSISIVKGSSITPE